MEIYGMTGEKLGTIGEPDRPIENIIPEWKKAFLSTPSVSVRKGIASNYELPFENTSTLVLTAPSCKFVDIRFPLTYDSSSIESIVAHPHFWAFSGTVKTTFLEPPGHDSAATLGSVTMPYSAHAVFVHTLDSKGPGIVDEGDMFLLPNGDTMEVGIWTSPTTGKYEMYKEYWTQPSPRPQLAGSYHNNQEIPVELKKIPCIVAELKDSDRETKGQGIIIRIGDFIQGIYKGIEADSPCVVGRWENHEPQSLMASGHRDQDSHSEWLDDPRNTGSENYFPLRLLFDHHNKATIGETADTSAAGCWHIVEISR